MGFTIDDLIDGDRVESIANIKCVENRVPTWVNESYPTHPVAYAITEHVKPLFDYIETQDKPFIVVTHNSDGKIKAEKDCGRYDAAIE